MPTIGPDPTDAQILKLANGKRYYFRDGLCVELPTAKPGVYAIWEDEKLLYVGIAGRSWKSEENPVRMKGIKDRLDSHHKARRSGSTMALAVWDRLITPLLSSDELTKLQQGTLDPDRKIRDFVWEHLSYSFITAESYPEAMKIETRMDALGPKIRRR